jgi:AhpD family alkylhydroperoxidase
MSDDLYKDLRRLSPKVTGGLVRMREETFKDGSVSSKYKILAALSIVVATKCEPCIRGYTKMAFQANTTEQELVEFLNVAMTESGCPGEQWAMKSLQVFTDLQNGKHIEGNICCEEESNSTF